jgi:hypothetical protein
MIRVSSIALLMSVLIGYPLLRARAPFERAETLAERAKRGELNRMPRSRDSVAREPYSLKPPETDKGSDKTGSRSPFLKPNSDKNSFEDKHSFVGAKSGKTVLDGLKDKGFSFPDLGWKPDSDHTNAEEKKTWSDVGAETEKKHEHHGENECDKYKMKTVERYMCQEESRLTAKDSKATAGPTR